MNETLRRYLERITSHSESLAKACKERADEWESDGFLVIAAYGHIGQMIVEEFHDFDDRARKNIFDEIEAALQYDDEELDYALTVGLLEGLGNEAERTGNWPEVRPHLGPVSVEFVDSWLSWSGADGVQVGNGSTAALVRKEFETGVPIGGRFHLEKVRLGIKYLEKWLRENPNAAKNDRIAAEHVMKDMQNALEQR